MLRQLGAVLLLCGQAQAADYVRCEAMQKAYNRLVVDKTRAGWMAYDDKRSELCPNAKQLTPYAYQLERLACTTMAVHEAGLSAREKAEAEYAARLNKVKADYAKEGCL